MGLKVFKSIKEEYNYYIDTFIGQLNSEENKDSIKYYLIIINIKKTKKKSKEH